MRVIPLAPLFFLAVLTGCSGNRRVEAWVESRDPSGRIVPGATVEVDGQEVGLTDERGLYKVKIDRKVGERVRLSVFREAGAGSAESIWQIVFTVGTNGHPVESQEGWLTAVLQPGGAGGAPPAGGRREPEGRPSPDEGAH